MSFLDAQAWPQGLLDVFTAFRQQSFDGGVIVEARYYGPFNALLNYCFPVTGQFRFIVTPQHPPSLEQPRDSVDVAVYYLVIYNSALRPVLFAEIKDDSWANSAEKRLTADKQVRSRFYHMLRDCPIPTLHGFSFLGTRTRIYKGDVQQERIEPHARDRPDVNALLPKDFLEGQWDLDILSHEGFIRMKEIVSYILQEC